MSHKNSKLIDRLLPTAMLLVSISSIQGGAALAYHLFPIAGPTGVAAIRLILAAALMSALFRPWRFRLPLSAWPVILVYGLAIAAMNFLLYQAIARIPLGIAIALEFTGPLFVAVLSSQRRLDGFWVALAIAGLTVLLWPDKTIVGDLDPLGMTCALGAGACWALYIVFGRKAGQSHGLQSAVLGILIAAALVGPAGVASAGLDLLNPYLLVLGAAVAVLSTSLPYTLEMIAMPRMRRASFGTLMSLEPAVGALCGLLFLGQALGTLQWVAIAAIVCASVGTTLTPEKPAAEETPPGPVPPPD